MKKFYRSITALIILFTVASVDAREPVYMHEFTEPVALFATEEDMVIYLLSMSGKKVPGAMLLNASMRADVASKGDKFAIIGAIYLEEDKDIIAVKIRVLGKPGDWCVTMPRKSYKMTKEVEEMIKK